jgi:predicted acetyltransferase
MPRWNARATPESRLWNPSAHIRELSATSSAMGLTAVSATTSCRHVGRQRHAFILRVGGRLAGSITRFPRATILTTDVAEFFVLRRFRRTAVGRRAAALLWNAARAGSCASPRATVGTAFWKNAIESYSQHAFSETTRPGSPHNWRVFRFTSPAFPSP